ncbi:hypothetical protein [Tahibacter amnicola]|uniref:Uncharacterized protein n=1 Tax=Tahibacter amnicola TaxID=2976241 RepID=A0ABY6BEX7_9GAMM|nr:hypothetical protein [Tahibacter amnicola]UXI68146.1 hypothetical protein N4264_00390 [Tahibacter amnicola]
MFSLAKFSIAKDLLFMHGYIVRPDVLAPQTTPVDAARPVSPARAAAPERAAAEGTVASALACP